MDKATEGLLNYGPLGIMAVLFLTAIVVLWFLMQNLYKRIIEGKDEVIKANYEEKKDLLQRLEMYEDRENMRIRDVHEVMTDMKDLVGGVVDTGKGIREMMNIIADRILQNKTGL
jgi:hypothetical protein